MLTMSVVDEHKLFVGPLQIKEIIETFSKIVSKKFPKHGQKQGDLSCQHINPPPPPRINTAES